MHRRGTAGFDELCGTPGASAELRPDDQDWLGLLSLGLGLTCTVTAAVHTFVTMPLSLLVVLGVLGLLTGVAAPEVGLAGVERATADRASNRRAASATRVVSAIFLALIWTLLAAVL